MLSAKQKKINVIILAIIFIVICSISAIYISAKAGDGAEPNNSIAVASDTATTEEAEIDLAPITFDITFNAEESQLDTASKSVTTGEPYGDLPIPTKDGYEFVGWFTERAEGTQVTADQIVNNENDNNLYVRWKKTSTGVDKSGKGLPVLMYHFFYIPGVGEQPWRNWEEYWTEVTQLETQMEYLGNGDFYFPSWPEVSAYVAGEIDLPPKSVVFTTDDGHPTYYEYLIPLAEKYNIKNTVFIITNMYDFNESITEKYYNSELINLQSHTHDMHYRNDKGKGYITSWPHDDAVADINRSHEILRKTDAFAYPYGHYTDDTRKVLDDAGCQLAFTTQPGRVFPGMDRLTLPRVRIDASFSFEKYKELVN